MKYKFLVILPAYSYFTVLKLLIILFIVMTKNVIRDADQVSNYRGGGWEVSPTLF